MGLDIINISKSGYNYIIKNKTIKSLQIKNCNNKYINLLLKNMELNELIITYTDLKNTDFKFLQT